MSNNIYQEIRGSMTQFEPVTPEQVEFCSEGRLTYEQFSSILEGYGLSIRHVLHDPSRSFGNTFYVDYENALYRSIYLSREYLESGGLVDLEAFSKMAHTGNPYLRERDWVGLYSVMIPLPMLIYDFNKRVKDIEPDKVFEVWYGIHRRIDYSNGMWQPETLDYVFDNAPGINGQDIGGHGLLTLYRGMGKLSCPPESAISWSTHPGNALWFANHTGRGTHLVTAEVDPKDVVAYYPGFQNENEIIVRPHTIRNIQYEDMFPADEETVIKLTLRALPEYQFFGHQAEKYGYQVESSFFSVHGIKHILRVLLLSLIYVYNSGEMFTSQDRDTLIYFSLLHDVGRTNEDKDDKHGNASVEMIEKSGFRIRGIDFTAKDYHIAHLLIKYHCLDDDVGIAAIRSQPGFSKKEKDRVEWLYKICKDMDGLDRVRFNGLDYRMLRTKFAKRLPLIAGCLLKEDMILALGR